MKRKTRTGKHAGGRPSKYQSAFAVQAAKLCALGAIDRDLAEFFGVSEKTINNWKYEHSEFLQSIKGAKQDLDVQVERRLFERAIGFQHPELYIAQYQGRVITKEIVKQYPPEVAAMIFWLKNRQPDRWREKIEHEHGGAGGGPVPFVLSLTDLKNLGGPKKPDKER
jgi:hypothetical protein